MRSLSTDLRNSLLTEDAFAYAHLVKFERPLKTTDGKSPRRAKDYVYITDGSTDLSFNDGSSDLLGNANGSQTYIANKLLKVGTTSESTEAKTSSINLQIAATAIGLEFQDTFTISSTSIIATSSFIDAGFREGDTITLAVGTGSGHSNDTAKVRINGFTNNDLTASVTPLSKLSGTTVVDLTSLTSETKNYTISFDNPEVGGVLLDRGNARYARYINREVFIYKVHINPDTGAFIGDPYLLFKGIIAQGKLDEDVTNKAVINWTITSHWGDFIRVQGRITSDPHHRALDGNGRPDPQAVIKPDYMGDLGFMHSEQSINIMAIYQVMETRYKLKKKKKWLGLKTTYRQEEYQVEVDREADLRFDLSAKHLPVVYGVNKIDSIPVFVDTLATNAKVVYVAYALCEGEIGGIYDIYFDDNTGVCVDKNDNDTRSSQTDNNTVDVLCEGRMDRGDVLTPHVVTTGSQRARGTGNVFGGAFWSDTINEGTFVEYDYEPPASNWNPYQGASIQGHGITHERGRTFTTPIDTRLIVHTGKPNQKADSLLLANASNFKIGSDYYSGSHEYWGSNHRLLDTAYVVAEYTIGEGETTIPSLDFVVRGKAVDCFNYDFSYEQDPQYSSADAATTAFDLGETVTLKNTATNATLGTVDIGDIYSITNVDGTTKTLVRFNEAPPIGTVTAFYMESGSDVYHFVTTDHIHHSGTVDRKLQQTISSVADNSNGTSVNVTINAANAKMQQALTYADIVSISDAGELDRLRTTEFPFIYDSSANATLLEQIGRTVQEKANLVSKKVSVVDCVVLASSASSTDNAYNGMFIEITHQYDDNVTEVSRRKIIDYDGATRVAQVDRAFSKFAIPDGNDTYKIFSGSTDQRVSLNPAMQLLDYLRSDRYGRNLSVTDDIDLESFKQAARDCDTRSEVTILSTASPTVGDKYEFRPGSNPVKWVGTVKSVTAAGVGSLNNVTFQRVSGKLVNRWFDWKAFRTGDLYYYQGALHQASGNGAVSTPSVSSSVTSLNLTKIGTSSTLAVYVGNSYLPPDTNPVVRKYDEEAISGYHLYDSDDVKYWRYLGWEGQEQRQVTRHQTNAVIDTASPVFDNINGMLQHFNGVLSYSNGKYSLSVNKAASVPSPVTVDGVSYIVEDINEDDIIGKLDVSDSGQKGTYNQVSVSIDDPQNRFEARSVTMFNSEYLKEDRMVPKKGDVKAPYVTNYFNARLNAKQYLDSSRAAIQISFTMAPRGVLLKAGEIIRMTYPRFGWSNKLYRIKNINFQENCLVRITAEEHNDLGYLISPKNPVKLIPGEPTAGNLAIPAAPTGLSAATNTRGGVTLNWTNSTNFNPANYTVQIWRTAANPYGNSRSDAVMVGISKGSTFNDPATLPGQNTFYYWVRYAVAVPQQKTSGVSLREVFSGYNPLSSSGGVTGIFNGAVDGITINFTNSNASVLADEDGNIISVAGTSTQIQVFITDSTPISYDATSPFANNSFRVTNVVASGVTAGSSSNTSDTYTQANITAMPGDTGTLTFTIVVKDPIGTERTFTRVQTFTRVKSGKGAKVVHLEATDYSVVYDSAGANPSFTSPSGSPNVVRFTATAQNYVSPQFRFTVNGTAGSFSTTATHDITYAGTTFGTNRKDVVKVEVREGSSGTIIAEDSVAVIKVKSGSAAVTTHEVTVFQAVTNGTSYADLPADPTAAVYKFSTSEFTSGLGSWSQTFPQAAKNETVWAISASPSTSSEITSSTTVTLSASDFSHPLVVESPSGINICYKYHSSGTTAPSITSATALGVDDAAGIPSGWYDTPALARSNRGSNDLFLWQSAGTVLDEYQDLSGQRNRYRGRWIWLPPNRVDGSDAYTVILSNESHSFPAASNGAVSSFTGSGTTIEVLRGGTTLTGILTGNPTADQFKVVSSGTNINPSSSRGSSVSNGIITYNDHGSGTIATGVNNTTASIEYTITISADDTEQIVTKRQTFTKSIAGARGSTGPQGTIGPTGARGSTGPQGTIGPTGATGQTGIRGVTGFTGLTGIPGVTGAIGSTGPRGTIGPTGATGLRGTQGPRGTIGITGPRGSIGPIGSTGPQGTIGPTGATGLTGLRGTVGPTGDTGFTGSRGPIGSTGPTGQTGETGAGGATGSAGSNAYAAVCDRPAVFFGEVNNSVTPSGNQLVTFTFSNGSTTHERKFNFSANASNNSITATNVSGDSQVSYDTNFGPRTVTSGGLLIKVTHSVSGLKSQSLATYITIKGS